MTIHFLLSAEARTLSVLQVAGMSDDEAFVLFRRLRWGEGDEVVCPHCGTEHRHYFKAMRDAEVNSRRDSRLRAHGCAAFLMCARQGALTWRRKSSTRPTRGRVS
ncbi:transposase [Propionivibrio sp.]|uniref:transposase n=1 Tax=Propionivibrio sp. TaxID=2212460 RepID=UPI003BF42DB1